MIQKTLDSLVAYLRSNLPRKPLRATESSPTCCGTPAEIDAALNEGVATIVLEGETVLYSLSPLEVSPAYVEVKGRTVRPVSLLNRDPAPIYMALSAEVQGLIQRYPHAKFYFGVDFVLQWARSVAGEAVVVAGWGDDTQTILRFVHVRKRTVVRIEERALGGCHGLRFEAELQQVLEWAATEFAGASMHWAVLGDPVLGTFEGLPAPIATTFRYWNLKHLPYYQEGREKTTRGAPVIALTLVVTAAAGYVGAVGYPYYQYLEARSTFQAESSAFQAELPYAEDLVKGLRAKKEFLARNELAQQRLDAMVRLMRAVAFNEYKANWFSARISDAIGRRQDEGAPFEVELEMETEGALSALEQSKPVLELLAGQARFDLQLPTDGNDSAAATAPMATRKFRIEGNMR